MKSFVGMDKILKNNLWNRIFHSKEWQAQFDKYKKACQLCGMVEELIQDLNLANTLDQLLDIHKKAWKLGFQNENLDVCSYGIFRGKDVESLTIDEVYLGNIYGLFTYNIRYWNQHATDTFGVNDYKINEDTKIYSLIMKQYRRLLCQNFRLIEANAKLFISKYSGTNKIYKKKYEFM